MRLLCSPCIDQNIAAYLANPHSLKSEIMEIILNAKDSSHAQKHLATNWQILGGLELSVEVNSNDTLDAWLKEILNPLIQSIIEVNSNDTLDAWLKEILNPLDVHTDFLNRILNSAHQTVVRILKTNAQTKFEHIHLLVFAPSNRKSNKKTWGFFSVERLEDTKEDRVAKNHSIEIYLYMEGDASLMDEKTS